jgi:monoamine oxidase
VLADLAERFGGECRSPVDYVEQDWSVERHSGGGMISHAPPGERAAAEVMQREKGRRLRNGSRPARHQPI